MSPRNDDGETTVEIIDRRIAEEVAEVVKKQDKFSIIKGWWPVIVTACLTAVGYIELQSTVKSLNADVTELKSHRATTEAQFTALKIEQTKVQGQIEALSLMIKQLQETANRIERKIEK